MTAKDISDVEPRLLTLTLVNLIQRGRNIELAALTTENATTPGEERLGDAILSLSPEGRELSGGVGRLMRGE